MTGQLKICHHNVARGKEITQSLFEVSLQSQSDFIFLQEPYVYFNNTVQSFSTLSHPSFNSILPSSSIGLRPRLVTYVNRNSPYEITPRTDIISDPDMQAFEVTTHLESFLIIHVYNEKSTVPGESQTSLQRIFQSQFQINMPFLLLGDLNLHHSWWNPMVSNPSSQTNELFQFLQSHEANLLVDPEVIEEFEGTFHRSNTRSTSIIDLAFSAGFKKLEWQNWRYGESTGSDHEVIFFEAIFPPKDFQPPCLPPTFNLKKANWKRFGESLSSLVTQYTFLLHEAIEARNPDQVAFLLGDIIIKATKGAIPRCRPTSYSKSWWTEDLTLLRKEYHIKKRRSKKSWLPSDIEEARLARNIYFRTISFTKKKHWEEFLAGAQDKSLFKAFGYSSHKYFQKTLIPILKDTQPQGEVKIASTFVDKCNALVRCLFPNESSGNNYEARESHREASELNSEAHTHLILPSSPQFSAAQPLRSLATTSSTSQAQDYWEWPELSLQELLQAVPAKKTAPGKDNIDWVMIKVAIDHIPQFFLQAYSYLFQCGQHPSVWKEAIGIIIPKKNKPDYSLPKSYRPISLIPCLSKLLERVFSHRTSYHANVSSDLLHPSQMGGRKQRSAIDAILLLQDFTERQIAKNKIVTSVFLDVMGAFDRIQADKLCQILSEKKLPPSFVSWVQSFLSGRKISLLFDGQLSQPYHVTGAPQGSPISPLLFLLYLSPLFPPVPRKGLLEISFVDDISISYSSYSVKKNISQLQDYLSNLFTKADSLSITFEKSKTELVHFSRKKQALDNRLQIGDLIMIPKPSVK